MPVPSVAGYGLPKPDPGVPRFADPTANAVTKSPYTSYAEWNGRDARASSRDAVTATAPNIAIQRLFAHSRNNGPVSATITATVTSSYHAFWYTTTYSVSDIPTTATRFSTSVFGTNRAAAAKTGERKRSDLFFDG